VTALSIPLGACAKGSACNREDQYKGFAKTKKTGLKPSSGGFDRKQKPGGSAKGLGAAGSTSPLQPFLPSLPCPSLPLTTHQLDAPGDAPAEDKPKQLHHPPPPQHVAPSNKNRKPSNVLFGAVALAWKTSAIKSKPSRPIKWILKSFRWGIELPGGSCPLPRSPCPLHSTR